MEGDKRAPTMGRSLMGLIIKRFRWVCTLKGVGGFHPEGADWASTTEGGLGVLLRKGDSVKCLRRMQFLDRPPNTEKQTGQKASRLMRTTRGINSRRDSPQESVNLLGWRCLYFSTKSPRPEPNIDIRFSPPWEFHLPLHLFVPTVLLTSTGKPTVVIMRWREFHKWGFNLKEFDSSNHEEFNSLDHKNFVSSNMRSLLVQT